MAEHTMSVEIDAEPADVFEYLVTPEAMTAWMGQRAVLEPQPNGVFEVDIAGSPIRGRYLEVERPRRVVVSWGVAGSGDLPPGASTWRSRSPRRHVARVSTSCTLVCRTRFWPGTPTAGRTSCPGW